MRHITLSMITGEGDFGLVDEPETSGEDDGAPQPMAEGAAPAQATPGLQTTPIVIWNPAEVIRSYHARKYDKPGSRIAFVRGGSVLVAETPEQITSAITALYN